jgi:sigma-B regulation protein RsbQ
MSEADEVRRRHNVVVTGRADGPVLVLAHGFGCDQHMWRYVHDALAERCTVVVFDHAGTGRADPSAWSPDRHRTLDGYADDVVRLCRSLVAEKGPVFFVGHSVSASIGVLAAVREPELFAGLVLLTPSARYVDDTGYRGGFSAADIDELLDALDSNYLGWSSAVAPMIMGEQNGAELVDELSETFCRMDPRIAQVFARATFLADNRADLAGVRTPTLIVQSAHDAIAPREAGEYVHRRIPGSRLVTIDSIGHCPHMSAPEETAAAVLEFVVPVAARR